MYIPFWSNALFARAQAAKREAINNNYIRQMESLNRKVTDRKQDMNNTSGFMNIDTNSPYYVQQINRLNTVTRQTEYNLQKERMSAYSNLDLEGDEWWLKQAGDTIELALRLYGMGSKSSSDTFPSPSGNTGGGNV